MRQPLQKIMIPILDEKMKTDIEGVSAIIKSEINVKEIEFLGEDSTVLTKQIKPNFKTLGPKFEKDMKLIAAKIAQFSADNISEIETAKLLEASFESTLDLHNSFMEEAAGGNPLLASHKTKKAIFNVMVKLHDIILVQDQMDLPN